MAPLVHCIDGGMNELAAIGLELPPCMRESLKLCLEDDVKTSEFPIGLWRQACFAMSVRCAAHHRMQ
jgi:hypothetical protein